MEYEPILVTKKRIGQAILHCVLAALMLGMGCVLFYSAFTGTEYVQLIPLLGGLFLCLAGVFLLMTLNRLVSYRLYEDRLEIISLSGELKQTVPLKTITSWSEVETKGRSQAKYLTVNTGDGSFRINNRGIAADYEKMKARITNDNNRVARNVNRKAANIMAFIFLVIGVLCLAGSYGGYKQTQSEVRPQDLAAVGGEIINSVKIYSTGGRNSRDYIRIVLSQYPQFVFKIDYAAYRALRRHDYLESVHRFDSVYIDVLADDYLKKMAKEKPLTFFDKTVNYRDIAVYGLRDAHNSYLSLCDYNRLRMSDKRYYATAFMGLFSLLFAGYVFVKNNKAKVM